MSKDKYSLDMTAGSIPQLLLRFAIPLLIGNIFQQMYNLADSVVVGNFVGKEALAAVGSTTPICNTMVNFFNGVSIGAGVVISRYFGAHDRENLHRSVETTMGITFLVGLLFTLISIPLLPQMLTLMAVPEDVMSSAYTYLRIWFNGISALLVYNMVSAVLRAVGDTKKPLYMLIFSSILNIVLDIVFIVFFGMDIEGVAAATVVSEVVSAILVLVLLCRADGEYRFVWKDLTIDFRIALDMLRIGLPAGLQQTITAMSNVVVQAYVNAFGSAVMAGWSCYLKIDQFATLPMQSMAHATTTFVGQNIGARDEKRARKGTTTSLLLSVGTNLFMTACVWIFAPVLVRMFINDDDVIHYGVMFLRYIAIFKVVCSVHNTYFGALRGRGVATPPMIIQLCTLVGMRQIYLLLMSRIYSTPFSIGFGYPLGWILCASSSAVFYHLYMKKHCKKAAAQKN